jgi:hypothetical protein
MAKKKSVKKSVKKTKKKFSKGLRYNAKRLRFALLNFIFFAILYLISIVLSKVFVDELLVNLFWVIGLITGFLALAFLLIILIFFFLKLFKN